MKKIETRSRHPRNKKHREKQRRAGIRAAEIVKEYMEPSPLTMSYYAAAEKLAEYQRHKQMQQGIAFLKNLDHVSTTNVAAVKITVGKRELIKSPAKTVWRYTHKSRPNVRRRTENVAPA